MVRWSFGDGAVAEGPVVRHAFPKAGTYEVLAAVDGEIRARATVVVLSRSVWGALPSFARNAWVVPQPRRSLADLVDAAERMFGASTVSHWLTDHALPAVALEEGGTSALVDVDEGLLFFEGEGDVEVTALGLIDRPSAMASLVERLDKRLGQVTWDGDVARGMLPDGRAFALGHIRGYAYLCAADTAVAAGRMLLRIHADAVVAHSRAKADMFEAQAAWVYRGKALGLHTVVLGFDTRRAGLSLSGFGLGRVAWDEGPPLGLLPKLPEGAVAAVASSLQSDVWDEWLRRPTAGAARTGKGATEQSALLKVLSGRFEAGLFVDVERTYREFLRSKKFSPQLKATAQFAVAQPTVLSQVLERFLSLHAKNVRERSEGATRRWAADLDGTPLEAEQGDLGLRLDLGNPPRLPGHSVSSALAPDGGAAPLGLALWLDVARLKEQALASYPFRGQDAVMFALAQSLVSAALKRVPAVDTVVLHAHPSDGGVRLSGQMVYSKGP